MTSPYRPTPPWERLLIVGVAVGGMVVAIAVGAFVEERDGAPAPTPVAAATAPDQPLGVPTTDEPSPTPTADPSQSGPAWTPCAGLCPDSDSDFSGDTCTASQYAEQYGNNGLDSVTESMIENKQSVNPGRLKDCPKYLPAWQKAQTGFPEGAEAVPGDVKPGTYETIYTGVNDCYWERSRNGHTVANNFITASTVKQRVTIRASDDTFVSRGCGDWVKAG